jgi:hypothetical protein
MGQPDFFLASSEGYNLEIPRECFRVKRMKGEERDDFLLVDVHPPLGPEITKDKTKIADKVILASRLGGFSLFPLSKFPIPVYVVAVLDETWIQGDFIPMKARWMFGWGELYRTSEDAIESVRRSIE